MHRVLTRPERYQVTRTELETTYSFIDLMDVHAVLDAFDEAEAEMQRRTKEKARASSSRRR